MKDIASSGSESLVDPEAENLGWRPWSVAMWEEGGKCKGRGSLDTITHTPSSVGVTSSTREIAKCQNIMFEFEILFLGNPVWSQETRPPICYTSIFVCTYGVRKTQGWKIKDN